MFPKLRIVAVINIHAGLNPKSCGMAPLSVE